MIDAIGIGKSIILSKQLIYVILYTEGEKMNNPIYETLDKYRESGEYPWHMPGHKRKFNDAFKDPMGIDITEIKDMDEYHHPEGIIKESQDKASSIYGSLASYYLVNGSTSGILSSISALARPGSKIIVARNCHKSVYNAIRLLNLQVKYVYPDYLDEFGICGGISADAVTRILDSLWGREVKAIVIVSPTYEGIVSDVEAISEVAHRYGVPLIVDSAHGAHFEYSDAFPTTATRSGADIVIESLHKTLPSFTQTGIMHVTGEFIEPQKLFEYVSLYQSTSPSYVFMAGMEYAIDYMNRERALAVAEYVNRLKLFREKLLGLKNIRLLAKEDIGDLGYDYDISKIVLSVKNTNMTGIALSAILQEKYGQVMEMAALNYVIAMTSVMDEDGDFDKLYEALKEIDDSIQAVVNNRCVNTDNSYKHIFTNQAMTIAEARDNETINIDMDMAMGRICGDFVYLYPPGIPLIAPGEIYTNEILEEIKQNLKFGANIKGVYDNRTVCVVAKEGLI